MESNPQETPEQISPLQQSLSRSLSSVHPIFKIQVTRDLAKTLGMRNGQKLTWLWKNKSRHYTLQKIRKRSGGFRTLHIPDKQLREAQFLLLTKVLDRIPVREYLWAFEKGKSVAGMANMHTNKDVVLSIDLEDYFGKVHVKHILPILEAHGIGSSAARVVAELCCYKYFLPQGGVTSPKLSNLVAAYTFGPPLKEYADSIGATLTIYADDVTLSFNGHKDAKKIVEDITAILKQHGGFSVNSKKTKVMTRLRRQFVCGVVVNKKPNLAREERNRLRAIIKNIELHGISSEAAKNDLEPDTFISSIRGRINWYKQLNPTRAEKMSVKFEEVIVSRGTSSQQDAGRTEVA